MPRVRVTICSVGKRDMSMLPQTSDRERVFARPFAARETRRVGRAVCYGHHGELFQGQIEARDGAHHRCLVSLPCIGLKTDALVRPARTRGWRVIPEHKVKARRVVELTATYLGIEDAGGVIVISSNIEEGKGYGSSTADCVAATRATANAYGQKLTDAQIADLCVRAEIASDNLMFDSAVLFAHREGFVLEDYRTPLPEMEVLGIDTELSRVVDTLAFPPAVYSWRHIQTFGMLAGAMRRAFATRDLALLGRIATASAILNDEFLPKPMLPELLALTDHLSLLGVAAAHSGTLISLLLDPADAALEQKIAGLMDQLDRLGVERVYRFRTSHGSPRMRCGRDA
jgi:uncharacterized protein involved in propanediol utilization